MKRFLKDCNTMFKRCMRLSFRNPEMLVMAIFVPIVLLILFVYLFGGVMDTSHFNTSYVNYVFIGAMAVSICQGSATQATVVCSDIQKGILDRFISLPISRVSFVVGHVLAATLRTVIAVAILFGVGFIMGFRPGANLLEWLGIIGILVGFILAMSCLAVMFGLLTKTIEGSSGVPMFAQILVFLSSAFVPTVTMHEAFRYFAEHQPVTPIIDTMRATLLNVGEEKTGIAVLWIVGLIITGLTMSIFIFKRRLRK